MSADVVSAAGSIAAAIIALAALVVAIYAAVVSRRAATSAERQADIAAKAYQWSIRPKIDAVLDASVSSNSVTYRLTITRTGGPTVMYYKCKHSADLLTQTQSVYTRKATDRQTARWRPIYEDDPIVIRRMMRIDSEDVPGFLEVRTEIEISVSGDGSKPEDNFFLIKDLYKRL